MEHKYVEGYTANDIEFCPFCGETIGTFHSDGSCDCEECGRSFFIIENDRFEDN